MGTRVLEGDARAVLGAHLGAKPQGRGRQGSLPGSPTVSGAGDMGVAVACTWLAGDTSGSEGASFPSPATPDCVAIGEKTVQTPREAGVHCSPWC